MNHSNITDVMSATLHLGLRCHCALMTLVAAGEAAALAVSGGLPTPQPQPLRCAPQNRFLGTELTLLRAAPPEPMQVRGECQRSCLTWWPGVSGAWAWSSWLATARL